MFAMLKRILLAVLFAGLSSSAFAAKVSLFDNMFEQGSQASIGRVHSSKASGHVSITDDWHTLYTFDVSTGRAGHSTPTGSFRPIRMHTMWHSSKYENAPMPWSIFFYGGYAIHGTTDLKHLGHVASHGCVRLDPKNAKLLFDLVQSVGLANTKVTLIRS
jgi:lipoprotein-anchoring transpeptidase ErfK/SrfK